jgi:hypothetical protein
VLRWRRRSRTGKHLPRSLAAYDVTIPEFDPGAMARLDIELSAAALKYARDASGGQFDPRRLSLYNDVTPGWVKPSQSIKVLAWSPYAVEYLRGLHPTHPAYAAMKAALAEIRKSAVGAPVIGPIADGPIVKTGQSDARVPDVRKRLVELGYADAEFAADDPEVLDADLSVQLRLFQKATGIKNSGLLGPQTVKALNADHSAADEAKLLDNMERLRWLPKNLGARYVFVNQPAFEVRVMDKGEAVDELGYCRQADDPTRSSMMKWKPWCSLHPGRSAVHHQQRISACCAGIRAIRPHRLQGGEFCARSSVQARRLEQPWQVPYGIQQPGMKTRWAS